MLTRLAVNLMKSTKELARQLGLLRRRSTTTQQSRDVRKVKRTNQEFAYLIVIDFESTCWKDRKNGGQEIIEFPAVLLNTSTGSIESEFQTYVLPEENPQLSEFCTELTGITQDQVEAGIPLRVCLSKFSRWLKKQEDEKNMVYHSGADGKKLCTFVTWSDWDLSVCLHYECRRKQLLKPHALNSWIDLRATYKNFYQRKPNGLHGALQDVGIEFHGRQHSGLDDARNTASLAWRMMCDGCVMKITRSMPGTQQLKRKQSAGPSEPPPKQQTKPNTQQPIIILNKQDLLLVGRCRDTEDGLVCYTQGICEEAVFGDVNSNTFASTAGRFKIWEDDASHRSVIRPKTLIPSMVGNQHEDNDYGNKAGSHEQAMTLVSVQTSLGVQMKGSDILGRRETKRSLNTARTETKSVMSNVNVELNMKPNSSKNYSNLKPLVRTICLQSTVTSTTQKTGQSPLTSMAVPKQVVNPAVGVMRRSISKTPCTNKCSNSTRSSPQMNSLSSYKSPASVTPNSTTSNASPVFKTPMHSARKPSPSSGFKTPYAPIVYQTPGSTISGTSNRIHTTSLGCKITPPMCLCGRRAKNAPLSHRVQI